MSVSALLEAFLVPRESPVNFAEALALGLLGDEVSVFHVSGTGNTTTTPADLWTNSGGAVNRILPTQPTAVTGASQSADDASTGIGAREVELVGWDDEWNLATETLALDGTTPVQTTTAFVRLIRARVVSAGSLGHNAGDLAFSIDAKEQAGVPATENRSFSAQFSVPPGRLGFVYDWRVSASKGGGQIDYGAVRFHVQPKDEVFFPIEELMITDGAGLARSGALYVAQPQTDLSVRAWSAGSGSERWVASSYFVAILPAQ